MLRLDEQQQRGDKKTGGPEIDLAPVRGSRAGVDGADEGGRAQSAHGRHEDQPAQRAFHFTANELEEGHTTPPIYQQGTARSRLDPPPAMAPSCSASGATGFAAPVRRGAPFQRGVTVR